MYKINDKAFKTLGKLKRYIFTANVDIETAKEQFKDILTFNQYNFLFNNDGIYKQGYIKKGYKGRTGSKLGRYLNINLFKGRINNYKDINQRKLANELNVTPETITRWKNGRIVTNKYIKKIANILGANEDDLFYDL